MTCGNQNMRQTRGQWSIMETHIQNQIFKTPIQEPDAQTPLFAAPIGCRGASHSTEGTLQLLCITSQRTELSQPWGVGRLIQHVEFHD